MPPFPKVFRVRQNFQTTGIESIPETVAQALERLRPALKHGASVAVGAGSRGITNIAAIVRATGEGQRHILAEYGITEEAMGVPIRASMEVIELGQTPSGVRVFLDRNAAEADFILPVNRVKPHTDFKGETESGLVKMSAVGLGKLAGATEYHRQAYHLGFPRVFQEVAQIVLDTGHLLGGVAILENALHETAKIVAVGRENFIAEDRELLREAKAMMP